jgi:hypothetical protein
VYGGQDILNQDGNPEDSKSTKWTPKHIGLKSTDEVGVKIDIRHRVCFVSIR